MGQNQDRENEEREVMFSGVPNNIAPFRPNSSIVYSGDEIAKEWEQNPPTLESLQKLMEWWNKKPSGIHVTSIVSPDQGWPIAMHCPICKKTTFLLSPWAIKPEKGDYWRMNEICADSEEHTYNMSLTRWSFKLLDPPPSPRLPFFIEITREISIEEAKKRWPNTTVQGEEKK
jgi:hypothetical protein